MPIQVVLAENSDDVRREYRKALGRESDISVVGEADSGLDAVRAVGLHEPDVVVIGLQMPGIDGLEATWRITRALPWVKVLACSLQIGPCWVRAMTRAGAAGYIDKTQAASQLVPAIRTIAAGGTYFPPGPVV